MTKFRIPADDDYTAILGRAIYNFTYYEWVVVWTVEKLQPGYLNEYTKKAPTSGVLANKFITVVKGADPRLAACAGTFSKACIMRDQLLHAHPYTAAGGTQQLGYRGRHPDTQWPLADVEEAAQNFDQAACELSSLFDELLRHLHGRE